MPKEDYIFPSYLRLHSSGELERRRDKAVELLASCAVCPRFCGINRGRNELAECGIGREAVVSSFGPHYGEEASLVGFHGSGTIFFSGCNLHCVYCQNCDISQSNQGERVNPGRLASIMLGLQRMGCHNINFVSPTHVVPQIMEALPIAVGNGLNLPLVYNSGGYDLVEVLRLLEGIFDIYMPDAKYGSDEAGKKYSDVSGYWTTNRKALVEMHRQVGVLKMDENGIARRGLLIRHLLLPGGLSAPETVLRFIAGRLSLDTYVNIMDQYRPCYRAHYYPELRRGITGEEFEGALSLARSLGLHRGF